MGGRNIQHETEKDPVGDSATSFLRTATSDNCSQTRVPQIDCERWIHHCLRCGFRLFLWHQGCIIQCLGNASRDGNPSRRRSFYFGALYIHRRPGNLFLLWMAQPSDLQRWIPQRTPRLSTNIWIPTPSRSKNCAGILRAPSQLQFLVGSDLRLYFPHRHGTLQSRTKAQPQRRKKSGLRSSLVWNSRLKISLSNHTFVIL